MKKLWLQLQQIDKNCLVFFPDIFIKKTPPREFFFQILYARYRPLYDEVYGKVKERLIEVAPKVPEQITKPDWLDDMMREYSHFENPVEMS